MVSTKYGPTDRHAIHPIYPTAPVSPIQSIHSRVHTCGPWFVAVAYREFASGETVSLVLQYS
jgi:hypothetical protein